MEFNMKTCKICNIEKELFEFNKNCRSFDGKKTECKECQKISSKLYREKNRNVINERARIKYNLFPEIQKERTKKWTENNEEKYQETYKKGNKKWVEKNKDKRKKYLREYNKERLKSDNLFKLERNVRIRINKFIKNKKENSSQIIDCSYSFLKEYLEKKFDENMSWDNYGKWHIDHIIPLSSAKTEEDIIKLCHYTNLQPLWAEENLKKGCKIL
jgi:hypothetical protein